ncbi:hypothetical protein GCM10010116_10260 [Microbispora rosea subsp. aerata]|nr:hypothetical protein [Microbispora rosea]GGO05104.1 hypothetical protein GCM10010116_10260 [Microbispora rosea subsp. aerata]GIH57213.1 hypothetical protein Mro02_41270 [Microbispora rosea subsp. aerata]GLJ83353.1 hypothetical protein GCM10017588_20810 [Microbispora rosea subsp. aerata]
MTAPLTGQRSRSELIAELYERHAAGLFAYCHDQLGQTASAADAVVAVFTIVPTAEPPSRAALYALARREIYRRDVSYALPAVDSVADPATALIERVFRDIRPHQREVLLLAEVCGLTAPEISQVLDVAVDTAEELIRGARHRFTQTLETAVVAARSAPFVPTAVAEVYDAIGVSPIGDVLARLPWRRPAASVRNRVLSALPYDEPGDAPVSQEHSSKLVTKRLWPTTPTWPLPLSDPDQVTNTCVVKADAIAQPQGSRRKAKHEATTEPMPRLRGALLGSLAEGRLRRKRGGRSASAERKPAPAAPVEPQASRQEPAEAAPATPPTPEVTGETTETFDAFGVSGASHRADPFDALRVSSAPRPVDPLPAFGTTPPPAQPFDALEATPPSGQPFDAFGSTPPAQPFDAFGSMLPAQSFDAFGATPPSGQPFDAFGNTPRPVEPFDAFGATPPSGQPSDALGNTPPAQPFDAFGSTPPLGQPFDAFGSTPPSGQPFDAFGNAPRPVESLQQPPGATHTPHPPEALDALFDTLRFAVPFDAFSTADKADKSRQAESVGGFTQREPSAPAPAQEQASTAEASRAFPPAFPRNEEPFDGHPLSAPPAESTLTEALRTEQTLAEQALAEPLSPTTLPLDVFGPAPEEAERRAERQADRPVEDSGENYAEDFGTPFRTAEVADAPPSARTDDDPAGAAFATNTDPLVHPVVKAVTATPPAVSPRPGRAHTSRHTQGRNSGSKHAGRSSGRNNTAKSRRGKGDRHYDWLWEVVGILICLIIALIVFFNVPTVFTP